VFLPPLVQLYTHPVGTIYPPLCPIQAPSSLRCLLPRRCSLLCSITEMQFVAFNHSQPLLVLFSCLRSQTVKLSRENPSPSSRSASTLHRKRRKYESSSVTDAPFLAAAPRNAHSARSTQATGYHHVHQMPANRDKKTRW
jgi:hypothetical protein